MTKTPAHTLHLTNPWDSHTRNPPSPTSVPTRAPAGGAQVGQPPAVVSDHFGADTLPAEMHQRLARTLNPKELARAFAARVLDQHDRCMIFRHHLTDQFPQARAMTAGFDLPEHHDYAKLLEFMETGRWPKGTSNELVQLYPRLMGPVLTHMDATYQGQVHAEIAADCQKHGFAPAIHMLTQVDREITVACDAIRLAHLQGARSLHLSGHLLLMSLPPHLTSLQQLQQLTFSRLGTRALPQDLGKLKNLESLSMINMQSLRTLPDGVGDLQKLKTLTIGGSLAHPRFVLPESLATLPALQLVDVGTLESPRPAWLPKHVQYRQIAPMSRQVSDAQSQASGFDATSEDEWL